MPPLKESRRLYHPDYFGGIWEGKYKNPLGNVVESSIYFSFLGVLTLILAVFGLGDRSSRRLRLILLLLLGIAIAWMYRNPLMQFLLQSLPHGSKGSNSRFITLILFFASALAAFGLRDLERIFREGRYLPLLGALAVFVLFPVADGLQAEDYHWWTLVYPFLAVILVVFAAWLCRRHGQTAWIPPLLILLVVGDLFRAGINFNAQIHNELVFPRNNSIRYLLQDSEDYRVAEVSQVPLYHPNVLSYYNIPVVEGYSTVLPNRYAAFLRNTDNGVHITANGILFLSQPNPAVLRLLNVKYLLTDEPQSDPRYEQMLSFGRQFIYRLRDALPRLWCASDIFVEPDPRRLMAGMKETIRRYDRPVVLEQPTGINPSGICTFEDVRVYVNGLQFESRTEKGELLFLPYLHSEHWRAEIDGAEVPIRLASGAFMALELPPGDASVRIVFENRLVHYQSIILIALGNHFRTPCLAYPAPGHSLDCAAGSRYDGLQISLGFTRYSQRSYTGKSADCGSGPLVDRSRQTGANRQGERQDIRRREPRIPDSAADGEPRKRPGAYCHLPPGATQERYSGESDGCRTTAERRPANSGTAGDGQPVVDPQRRRPGSGSGRHRRIASRHFQRRR